jgi:integrase
MMMHAVDSYLAIRRAAGFDLRKVERLLRGFARHCAEREETHLSAQTAIAWAGEGSSSPQKAFRLKTVAQFARFIRAEDERHEVPPDDLFGGYQIKRRTPFIFSAEDVEALVKEALKLGPPGSLRPHVYSTIFGLLGATGMRASEALALRFEDITTEGLVIRNTKFGESRLLPLHDTATAALEEYLRKRRKVVLNDDHLFISWQKRPISYGAIRYCFQGLVRTLGFHTRQAQPMPRLHDLRHSFATRSLQGSPAGRESLNRHMLALSTYLGHRNIEHTYWYLEATPQLLARISSETETFVGGAAP